MRVFVLISNNFVESDVLRPTAAKYAKTAISATTMRKVSDKN